MTLDDFTDENIAAIEQAEISPEAAQYNHDVE